MSSPHTISNWLSLLRQRLKLPRHNESEQAIFRIVICLVFGLFLAVAMLFEGPAARAVTRSAIYIAGAYLVFGLVLLAWMRTVHDPMPARRILAIRIFAMTLDCATISACLYFAGENGTVLLSIYLWVTLGNGFRYGKPYLYAATVLSLAGFLIVFATSEYWETHRMAGIGWIAALVILPLFVSRLVGRLTQLTQEAQAASKAKSQFLARMSHELRTPLHGVIGMTHVLMQTPLSQDQKDIANSVNASSQMLSELIENVLDFSKIEAGKIEIERVDFDLHALLNGLMTVFVPQARNKGVDFRLHVGSDVPFYLNGDPLHLRQVLVNLVGNAIKFTERGHIDLSVRLARRPDSHAALIRFEVLDTGIGIPLEAQERIFESFAQADVSTTRRYGGTGLGTTIAKQLVKLMGGTLLLRSTPGEGSVFWFEIPLPTATGTGPLELPSGLSTCRTLVLSSDPMSVGDVTALLSRWSIPFTRVAGAAHAIATLRQAARTGTPYRIVLVDGNSSHVFPVQFVAAARADSDLYNLSAVLLRADSDRHSSDEYLKAGYTSVLRLPVDTRETFNILHSVIAREDDSAGSIASLSGRVSRFRAKRRLRILVAEDNRTNQVVIESILTSERHRVDIVADGEAALDALEKASYDLVIADLHMPNLGGLEAMRIYGFSRPERRVPWLILTGDATRETLEECAAAGADGYLTKPVQPTVLLARVAQLTESAREAQIIALNPSTGTENPADGARLELVAKTGTPTPVPEQFAAAAGAEIERMQRALMDADFLGLREATHTLARIASEFGATALARLASEFGAIPESILPRVAGTVMHDLVRVYEESRALLAATSTPSDPG